MTVREFLAEQGRLADAATPAPWKIEIEHHRCYLEDESDCEHKSSPITERFVFRASEGDLADAVTHVHESYEAHEIGPDVAGNYDYEEGGIIHTADAEFIAASRTSVPRMVRALEAVLREVEAYEKQPDELEPAGAFAQSIRLAITDALDGSDSEKLTQLAETTTAMERGDPYTCADLGHEDCDGIHRDHRAPVLPSSGVDEDALAEVRKRLDEADVSVAWTHGDEWSPKARKAHNDLRAAVAEWLKGQGR